MCHARFVSGRQNSVLHNAARREDQGDDDYADQLEAVLAKILLA
ncbi:hypothetical protein [Streptomyces malaysiensis]|nr:hypothetical protein [Streptomyces samsunensis]